MHILPIPTVDLLNICRTFKSLSEHAQTCYNFLEATRQQSDASAEQFVIGQLEELMRLGLQAVNQIFKKVVMPQL